ncbi:phosphatase PAP2 family protein [Novosphingobium profundi]|uniref:phosphatase PAP2 family protein n=1 Tax=Novosphingobium profundi TaxID=1774954 RepID=UPI001BDACE95|nr:phosphatase PAP2 family protein [Novosphingobium profundi]MBT0668731.1 phosphatase PAP2 family protein [Novosphingobium profundi]
MPAAEYSEIAPDTLGAAQEPAIARSHDAMIPSRALLGLLAGGALVLAVLMRAADLELAILSPGSLRYAAILLVLAVIHVSGRRPGWRARPVLRALADLAEYAGLFMAISLVGAIASYPVAALSHGFSDARLQAADAALHFHWLDWYLFVASHPWLQPLSRGAYAMIYVSPGLLLGWLAWTGQRREAHDFLAAVWLSATITLAAFYFMPAVGPFAYLWHGSIPYLPVSDLWQPQVIPQLRGHAFHAVDPGQLVGLVSAPSFHAAAGVLLIAFSARQAWRVALPLVAIDLAMLLVTPVEGTHYLIDLILGAGVAGLSLALIALWRERRGPRGTLPGAGRTSSALA